MVAFGETSISACNDSHSSQATSTLGNTPNLNIGLLHQKETPTLVHQTGTTTSPCTSQARFWKWKFQAAICFKPAFSFRGALRIDRRCVEYHLFRVVSDYLAFAYHAFGFMRFGDLCNFLNLLHRFCKSPQLVLTQLLQCSIAHRAPSKTVSFFKIEQNHSRLAFLLSLSHAVRLYCFQALYELANFYVTMPLNFAF